MMTMRNFRIHQKHAPVFHRKAWSYFYGFLSGYRLKLLGTTFFSVIQAGLIIPILLLVKNVFDIDIPAKQIIPIIWAGIAIIGLRLLSTILALFIRKLNIRMMTGFVFRIRKELMHKIYSFSLEFYTKEDQRLLQARIVEDTERIANLSHSVVSGALPALLISLGLMALLVVLNAYLFLFIVAVFPLIFLSGRYYSKLTRKRVHEFQRSFEGFSKITSFVMKFMELIRLQSNEQVEKQKHTDLLEDLREKTESMTYAYSLSGQMQNFLTGAAGILVLVAGGISVVNGVMTLGDFFAFYIAASQLQNNINTLSSAYTTVVAGNESLVTLYNIAVCEEEEPSSGSKPASFLQNIRMNNITFSYGEKMVLQNIDFEIKRGETVALVGPNGAGKTTLIRLLLGFYRPHSGQISVDGILYPEIDFHIFRRSVGVVLQHPPLIPGTIRDNIFYGNPGYTEEELMSAAQVSLAYGFIRTLPSGFDTPVGEDGILLSGGERQMVAIARALIRKPGLLILDEPTNHLDEPTVDRIMHNLVSLSHHPAILMISHNREVIRLAGIVFILENGKVSKQTV